MLRYEAWSPTCDTLHAHTQLLGKLAIALAPPEPQWQHAALRLGTRGWETQPLPVAGGAVAIRLDLHDHEAVVEHSDGRHEAVPLTPHRAVADVVHDVLDAVGGGVEIDPTPQEVHWTVPLVEDREHATYDATQVAEYFAAATKAALVLAEYRAPFPGRKTPVNAWWGSFDLAVSLFSGEQEVAVGWWPGDPNQPTAAYYGYANPARDGFSDADLSPARWESEKGFFLLESDDPAEALAFARALLASAG
jgi:Family of unknown function (DUF5996)